MTARRFTSMQYSGVLHEDALDDVRHVLAAIRRVLEEVEDLLPLENDEGVPLLLEQQPHRRLMDVIGFVLEPVDFDGGFYQSCAAIQRRERGPHLVRPGF